MRVALLLNILYDFASQLTVTSREVESLISVNFVKQFRVMRVVLWRVIINILYDFAPSKNGRRSSLLSSPLLNIDQGLINV